MKGTVGKMTTNERLRLYDPVTYVIRVEGVIDPAWSNRLGGMRINVIKAHRQSATELVGSVKDQAALIGILETLYDLGLPILSVERMAAV